MLTTLRPPENAPWPAIIVLAITHRARRKAARLSGLSRQRFSALFLLWPPPCLFPWPLPCSYPLPFPKEMALCIMTPQPAISSIPQRTEVGGEFTSHNLAPDGLPDAFGVQSVLKSIRGAKGQHRSQRRRCRRFECGPPDPHSLAALFERYDDRDGWRKNRPRGCTLQRRRKATARLATVPKTPLYGSTFGSANASSQESG